MVNLDLEMVLTMDGLRTRFARDAKPPGRGRYETISPRVI
jgi:hypothetical protein